MANKTEKKVEKDKVEKKEQEVKQNGVIVFGGGLDKDAWMKQAMDEGYRVTPAEGFAILFKEPKKA